METPHPLAIHLEATGEARASFARRIQISESHLSLIISRKRNPSLEVGVRIEVETKGKVPAKSLPLTEQKA